MISDQSQAGYTMGRLWPVYTGVSDEPAVAVVLSDGIECVDTHFAGRTLVCPGAATCELCRLGKRLDSAGYFVALIVDRQYLVRLSRRALSTRDPRWARPGTVIELQKRSKRATMRISALATSKIGVSGDVVSRLELLNAVACLHLLPRVEFDESYEANCERLRAAAAYNCRTVFDASDDRGAI